eukprot:scaffold298_cov247-Pinguiococcus_pyrenoidosus.AAC.35
MSRKREKEASKREMQVPWFFSVTCSLLTPAAAPCWTPSLPAAFQKHQGRACGPSVAPSAHFRRLEVDGPLAEAAKGQPGGALRVQLIVVLQLLQQRLRHFFLLPDERLGAVHGVSGVPVLLALLAPRQGADVPDVQDDFLRLSPTEVEAVVQVSEEPQAIHPDLGMIQNVQLLIEHGTFRLLGDEHGLGHLRGRQLKRLRRAALPSLELGRLRSLRCSGPSATLALDGYFLLLGIVLRVALSRVGRGEHSFVVPGAFGAGLDEVSRFAQLAHDAPVVRIAPSDFALVSGQVRAHERQLQGLLGVLLHFGVQMVMARRVQLDEESDAALVRPHISQSARDLDGHHVVQALVGLAGREHGQLDAAHHVPAHELLVRAHGAHEQVAPLPAPMAFLPPRLGGLAFLDADNHEVRALDVLVAGQKGHVLQHGRPLRQVPGHDGHAELLPPALLGRRRLLVLEADVRRYRGGRRLPRLCVRHPLLGGTERAAAGEGLIGHQAVGLFERQAPGGRGVELHGVVTAQELTRLAAVAALEAAMRRAIASRRARWRGRDGAV